MALVVQLHDRLSMNYFLCSLLRGSNKLQHHLIQMMLVDSNVLNQKIRIILIMIFTLLINLICDSTYIASMASTQK